VFIAGIATGGWAWRVFAWPIMTAQSEARHIDHFAWV
jgi:hypothetical protein